MVAGFFGTPNGSESKTMRMMVFSWLGHALNMILLAGTVTGSGHKKIRFLFGSRPKTQITELDFRSTVLTHRL